MTSMKVMRLFYIAVRRFLVALFPSNVSSKGNEILQYFGETEDSATQKALMGRSSTPLLYISDFFLSVPPPTKLVII